MPDTSSDQTAQSWALALLSGAAAIFLGSQIRATAMERPNLVAQSDALKQRVVQSRATLRQSEEALQQRAAAIERASALEARYAALLTELIEVSKTNPDALAVVQKWKIQQGGKEAAPASATPSAAPESKPAAKGKR